MSPSGIGPVPPSWLVGDIGATNLRFALAEPHAGGYRLSGERRMTVADHAGLESALSTFLKTLAPSRPRVGALAVAGPVLGDDIAVTNTGWRWSTEALRTQLGLDRLICLNDVEAQALALPHLTETDLRPVGRNNPPAITGAPRIVIAPGSGLGVSALVTVGGRTHAIAGEGGHVTMVPETEFECDLANMLSDRFGGHVSWERVLSGPGIELIHNLAAKRFDGRESKTSSEMIVRLAVGGDGFHGASFDIFAGLLGSYAGDLALIFGARGGVYIGGGILPVIGELMDDTSFRQRFESKGRFRDYLCAIPTAIIMHRSPGLIGAAAYLASMQGNEE